MVVVRRVLLAVCVAAVAGVGYFVWSRNAPREVAPDHPPADAKPQPEAPKPVAPAVATLPTPQSAGIPEEDCIVYPDGTRLPPLNGVKKAPPVVFHRLVPFARVVRKEFDRATGLEWYIHENGVRSTTRLQPNGEAVSEIDKPVAPASVANDK
jgi:hypothetical protein